MPDIKWYINRLKAMNAKEVLWRLQQKQLQKMERAAFKQHPVAVTDRKLWNDKLDNLRFKEENGCFVYSNENFSLHNEMDIFGIYSYKAYKKQWHAGFQTDREWERCFSYDINYRQRDELGDARTNWELNRHFQFPLLAKNYFASGEKKYLDECCDLFFSWNEENPFLYGISWTSTMEVAIRALSWMYTHCFLAKSKNVPEKFLEQLRMGSINMTEYIYRHYSRYSSANNHVIVEACALGTAGILFQRDLWLKTAVSILNTEIPRQNYGDGVNKEASLHYQTFFMEAVGLLVRLMERNKIKVPASWLETLEKMSRFVKNCMGRYGEVVVFGDNDEGRILDLCGEEIDHYEYVLEFMSCILPERYVSFDSVYENINWLFTTKEIECAAQKKLYETAGSISYKEGGNTLLKSSDGHVLIGIDHGELGFGSIAAHAHADALSFQMFVDGEAVFVDAGTYIYHIELKQRNAFRSTAYHNTVTLGGKDQSEMLGAFLWGRRAHCKLLESRLSPEENYEVIRAVQDGYKPCMHTRTFSYDRNLHLCIKDELAHCNEDFEITFDISPKAEKIQIQEHYASFQIKNLFIEMSFTGIGVSCKMKEKSLAYSKAYAVKVPNKAIVIAGTSREQCAVLTDIVIRRV